MDTSSAALPSGSRVRVIGRLTDPVAALLKLRSAARTVLLHDSVIRHIESRRGIDEAQFVLEHLTLAVEHPEFAGVHPDNHRRHVLIGRATGSRLLCVAIKCVSADPRARHSDEIWISTSFPMSERSLTRKRWSSILQRVGTGTEG